MMRIILIIVGGRCTTGNTMVSTAASDTRRWWGRRVTVHGWRVLIWIRCGYVCVAIMMHVRRGRGIVRRTRMRVRRLWTRRHNKLCDLTTPRPSLRAAQPNLSMCEYQPRGKMRERARDLCIQCEGETIINQEICVERGNAASETRHSFLSAQSCDKKFFFLKVVLSP